jgi:hypothetical protein
LIKFKWLWIKVTQVSIFIPLEFQTSDKAACHLPLDYFVHSLGVCASAVSCDTYEMQRKKDDDKIISNSRRAK